MKCTQIWSLKVGPAITYAKVAKNREIKKVSENPKGQPQQSLIQTQKLWDYRKWRERKFDSRRQNGE